MVLHVVCCFCNKWEKQLGRYPQCKLTLAPCSSGFSSNNYLLVLKFLKRILMASPAARLQNTQPNQIKKNFSQFSEWNRNRNELLSNAMLFAVIQRIEYWLCIPNAHFLITFPLTFYPPIGCGFSQCHPYRYCIKPKTDLFYTPSHPPPRPPSPSQMSLFYFVHINEFVKWYQ